MSDFDYFGLGDVIQPYDFTDKKNNVRAYITYMLNRVMNMFDYEGLPDTIPKRMLELYIMINGHSVVVEHDNNLYVCFGGWGGEPDEYYIPKNYIVANPYLNLFKTYTINEDCILVYNDSMYYGLMPLFRRYATALVENDLTMNIYDINSRIISLIAAQDDKTKASTEVYLQNIIDGKLGVIGSNAFFEGVKTSPYGERNNQRITDLIEYQQYIKASWFNEIGLNSNYNMKRESITANESQLNDDMLKPLIDDMFECRKQWVSMINNMFGTDITVRFNGAWADNEKELELEQEYISAQIENLEGGENNVPEQNKNNDESNISTDD